MDSNEGRITIRGEVISNYNKIHYEIFLGHYISLLPSNGHFFQQLCIRLAHFSSTITRLLNAPRRRDTIFHALFERTGIHSSLVQSPRLSSAHTE